MQYNIAIATNLYISREKNWRNATSPIIKVYIAIMIG